MPDQMTTLFAEHCRKECRWCGASDRRSMWGVLWCHSNQGFDSRIGFTAKRCAVQLSEIQWLEGRVIALQNQVDDLVKPIIAEADAAIRSVEERG